MAGALDGVRVLDFGQYIAGPMAGMLLADQGADVVRVEPPSGRMWDTPANATWNRGKRSIVLDLKRESDLDIAKRLIERADVPARVVISEYVEVAKAFFNEDEPRVVNGVLDKIARRTREAEFTPPGDN